MVKSKSFLAGSVILILALLLSVSITAFAAKDSEVTIGVQVEPSKLNPVTYQDTETGFVLGAICDPLIEVNEEGEYSTEGAVIEDYEIQEDGKVYVFHVREGIKFHNGEELTAEDVKFNYESFLDEDLASPHRGYYTEIEELKLVDEYTLKVILENVKVNFLTSARLRDHVFPKDYIEEVGWDGYEKHPIGSGPYKFENHKSGERISLSKNENYWGKEAEIEEVNFRFYPELSSLIMALQTNEVDYIPEMPADKFLSLRKQQNTGLSFSTYQKMEDHRISFNKREDSIFSDRRLRKAVAYAVNREELIALTREEMATPATGRVPGFHPASAPDAKAYEQDFEKSKELLKEAGYPDGFKTTIYAPSGYTERVTEAQQIARQLSHVGVEVDVKTLEWGTYLDATADGEAPMFRERWSGSTPSPYSFVEHWHPDSGWNAVFGTYENEEVTKLLDQIEKTVDQDKRWELYREVQQIAMDDVACYPLYWPLIGDGYNSELDVPENLWNVFMQPIYYINYWSFT
ncbi:ABC transporter substrate-binding protein [Candidatus Bipolaricaulota bacterium]|nr:ABC transporter substrate-binding protein [Candidatus Bipolaricaulota bacterium]MBS3825510.1 ABC transporter substrate-binding protein [Candidatus Bipolaricaulota bacterium]